jgi:hypothetical protein
LPRGASEPPTRRSTVVNPDTPKSAEQSEDAC